MNIDDIILGRRSIRQFRQKRISKSFLESLVNAGRLAPSASNLQPLEFYVVEDISLRNQVFPCLKWAAYIEPDGNPSPGREPAAYIFVLVNLKIRDKVFEYDVGAAMENMILTAWSRGVAGCWLLSVDRERLRGVLGVPDDYRIDSVLALGYPDEESVVEEFSGSIKYWKDGKGRFHVPKRSMKDIIHYDSWKES